MVKLNNIDITQHVDKQSIITNDTLDESLASGAFTIPFVSNTGIQNGDQPIPRLSEVNIDGLLYVVSEDEVTLVRKGTNKLYKHQVTLIEPTKILQKRIIPDLTVTQPQGDVANYFFTINNIDTNEFTDGGFLIDNIKRTIPLVETSQSQNTSIIENRTLKTTDPYEVNIRYIVENRQTNIPRPFGDATPNEEAEILLEVYYGSLKIGETTATLDGVPFGFFTPKANTYIGGFKIDYDPLVALEQISIKAKTTGLYYTNPDEDDQLYIKELSLTISQPEEVDDQIYLDQVVDKLLQFHPEFFLSEQAIARLSVIKSPEFTFQNYTLYDALREIANYATAIVYLGESDFKTIHFYFYDDDNQQDIEFVDETQVEYLDGFANGLEINAPNVIRDDNPLYAIQEPDLSGWLSLRSANDETGEQIIDTQTAVSLQHGIYRPTEVLVKGLQFTMQNELDETVTFVDTLEWNITDYVVEQQRYNTYTDQANLNSRGAVINKANTIYYRQGDNKLYGLGFIGTLPPAWNQPKPPNYAIHEAILNKAAEENPTYTFTTDYLIDLNTASIHDLQFKVKHIPYSDVRLTIYKDGSRGKNIIYFNEQASLNDMELLGRIAQENANRTGNRTTRLQGFTSNDRFLLGSRLDDKVLVNYTISRTPTVNKFVAEYAVGYANISDYVGIDSRYRQYEIPIDTIVNRRDKLTQFFDLQVSNEIPTTILTPEYLDTGNNYFFNSLYGNFTTTPSGSRPTYAKITIDNDKVVESTLDAYRMGRTLGLAFDMTDNFSAGAIKKDRQIYDGSNNINIKTQEDARYTNLLGRFTNARIEYFVSSGGSTLAFSDNYPDNDRTAAFKYIDYDYTVNKDARERWGFVWELVFQGDPTPDQIIKVYDAFVKYNRLGTEVTPNTVEIRFLKKGYLPERNLDITKTTLGTGTIQVPSGEQYLQIQATAPEGEYEGLILTLNEEPILAIQSGDYDFGTQVTKYVYARAYNETNAYRDTLAFNIEATLELGGFKNLTAQVTETIVGNLLIDGSRFLLQAGEALPVTITQDLTIDGSIFLLQDGTSTQTIESNLTINGAVFLTGSGTSTQTIQGNLTIDGSRFLTGSGTGTQTITGDLTITGDYTEVYTARGFTTSSPVSITYNFTGESTLPFTLQTFTQSIGARPDGTELTVTAPSSYVYNGDTYLFQDWLVSQTSESSTNTTFTITLNQDKTLRLRYIVFGQ